MTEDLRKLGETPSTAAAETADSATGAETVAQDTNAQTVEALKEKLPITATFEQLAERIPSVKAMIGMDQRSDFHSLTLDEHTKELVRTLSENEFIKNHPKRDLIILAGLLHDVGKTSPEGQQVHPKDPEKRQYVGHEKVSATMITEILPQYFVDLSEEDKQLVIILAGLHASALNLIGNFSTNKNPKGKDLGSYDKFMAEIEKIPGNLTLEDKMRIIFAINRADKKAGYNESSDMTNPKVQDIVAKSNKQIEALEEIEKALPVLIQAIQNRRAGDQEAGIVYDEAAKTFSLKKKEEKVKVEAKGLEEAQLIAIMEKFDKLGVPSDQKAKFEQTLRESGVPGLQKAGFGRAIGALKKEKLV